jgi:methyl-accepting chemotaxis protein
MSDLDKNNKSKTSLRKKMIFYFLLIAIANVFVAGEIVWELKSKSYRTEIAKEVTLIKNGEKPVEYIHNIFDKLAKKFVIMIIILIVVSAVVLFLFVIQIASPIQYMIDQARKMSDGDLSKKIDVKTEDEIAVLGCLINDLSVDLQEVIAQLERISDEMRKVVNLHENNLKEFPNIKSYFDEETEIILKISKELNLLKEMYILFTINAVMENFGE